MPAIPESTKTSLAQRLRAHAKNKWPQLTTVHVRYRAQFAYVAGELADGEQLPLMRLRYGGSTQQAFRAAPGLVPGRHRLDSTTRTEYRQSPYNWPSPAVG